MDGDYISGTCNISGAQLHKRKRFMAKCLGITVWAIALLQILTLSHWWRLPMVILFTLSIIGIQQVYFKFCYMFGLKGLLGMGELGKTQKVSEANIARDRARARKMIISSIILGIIFTIIYFLLPF